MTTTRPVARARQHFRALALTLIAVVALTACGTSNGGDSSASRASSPVDGGTLTLYTGSIAKLSPYNNRDFARPIVDSLVYQDTETLEFSPWLATSWEINEDGSVYVFHLRDDVTFSDGEKLDADVVKANFDFDKNVVVPAGGAYFRDVFDYYDRSEVLDPLTLEVSFTQSNVPFLTMLATAATGIISPASLTKTLDQINQGDYAGSGPFTLTPNSFQPGNGMELTKRTDYNWGPGNGGTNHTGPAYLDEIDFKFVDETGVREGAVQAGQADLVTGVSPDGEKGLAQDKSIQLFSRPQPGTQNGSQWNFNRPIPADTNVRRALQLAIDRETLSSAVTGPKQAAGSSPLEPSNLGYQDLSESLPYDPEQAKRILDTAGWTAGSDGIRQKGGQRLVLTSVSFDQGNYKTLMQLVKEQAKTVGIDLELTFDNNWSADWNAGKYDLLSSVYQTSPESDILRSLFSNSSSNTLKGGNPEGNEELTALLDRQVSVPDAVQRAELLTQAQRLIVDNSVYLVLNQGANVGAATSKIHGVDNFTTFSAIDLYNVWKDQ